MDKINIMCLPSISVSEKIESKLKEKQIYLFDQFGLSTQMLIDRLRIGKNIHIQIMCDRPPNTPWWYIVKHTYENVFTDVLAPHEYLSYEECRDAAILAALELV